MLGKFIWCSLSITAVTALLLCKSVAAAPQKIDIAPAIISKSLNPGSSISSTLTVTNQGTEPYGYSIYASPYGVQNGTYQPVFKTLPGFANITNWFSFTPTNGFLPPGKDTTINYAINVPAGTPAGSYYAAVFAESSSLASNPINKTQLRIVQRVGSLFYITVNGNIHENGAISSWRAPILQSSPVVATLGLKDSGTVYYVASAHIYFEDILGNVRYQYSTQRIVVPRAIRNIPVVWPKPPIIGIYKIRGTVTIYGQKQLPTRYILIVSTGARVVIILIVGAVIVFIGLQNILVTLVKNKSKKAKIKP